jgi:hypothetical protein
MGYSHLYREFIKEEIYILKGLTSDQKEKVLFT